MAYSDSGAAPLLVIYLPGITHPTMYNAWSILIVGMVVIMTPSGLCTLYIQYIQLEKVTGPWSNKTQTASLPTHFNM